MDVVLRCTTCYPVRLGNCPDSLVFNIGLTADTDYDFEICDSMGNVYEGTTTSDGSGNISISTDIVPFDAYPGLFNKFAGSFKITFYDNNGDAVPFTISGTEYTCIAFSLKDTVEVDDCNAEVSCGCIFGNYGVPSNLLGKDGDFYINANNGAIYENVDGTWTLFWSHGSSGITCDELADCAIIQQIEADIAAITPGITQLTGDVTAGPGSGSQAATIANDAVTFAKMQNIATDKLLGRDTALIGNVEEIGVTSGIEFDGAGNIQLANTAVTPGSYTNASITVDAKGRLTAAFNGAASSGKLVWAGVTDTVVSSAGTGYTIGQNIKMGSITLPANTVQNGDLIIIRGHWYVNQGGSYALAWYLRPTDTVPVLTTDATSAVWHEMAVSGYTHGFENTIYANANSCTSPMMNYTTNVGVGNYSDYVANIGVANRIEATVNTIDWTATNYFTFGYYGVVANTTRFMGAHVWVIRP